MDSVIKPKKRLARIDEKKCVYYACVFGYHVKAFDEIVNHPDEWSPLAMTLYAENALEALEEIDRLDEEMAMQVLLVGKCQYYLEMMIDKLGDEGDKYRKYIERLG